MQDICCTQGSLDVVCFLSKDDPMMYEPQSTSSGAIHNLSTPDTSFPSGVRLEPPVPGFFKVHLNKSVTDGLSAHDFHALACDFAFLSPGSILFQEGDEVMHDAKKMGCESNYGNKLLFQKYKNKTGKVVAHSKEEPLSVKVRLEGDTQDVNVLFSILTHRNASAESSVARTERMLASAKGLKEFLDPNAAADNSATIIGFSEFMRSAGLEREYWITLSLLTPLLREQLQKKFSANEHALDLCVMHVQYTSSSADHSNVHRASLRLTTSVAPKAYQDKCRACEECEARRQCANCQQSVGTFTKSESCSVYRNCNHCPEFKWAIPMVSCPLHRMARMDCFSTSSNGF